jgi:hypothetical protein
MILVALLVANVGAKDQKGLQETFLEQLRQKPLAQLVQTAQSLYQGKDRASWEALCTVIAHNRRLGRQLLERLSQDKTIAGATLYAEALLRCARGVEVPPWDRKGKSLDEFSLDQIGTLAQPLLGHSDPFVRALADRTIAR